MTGNDDTNGAAVNRRHVSRRGLLGVGLGITLAGCLRAGSDTPTATNDGTPSRTSDGAVTPESEPGVQSSPTGLTEAWSRERDSLALRAAPSNRSVVVAGGDGVRSVNPSDGIVRWDHETERIATRPTVTESTVYASGAEGTFYALARGDGNERWTYEGDTGLTTVPITLPEEDRVVVGAGDPVVAPTRGPRYVKRPETERHRATMDDFERLVKLTHQEPTIDVVGYDLWNRGESGSDVTV